MDLSPSALLALVRLSLQDPRAVARHLLGLGIPLNTRWLALILMAVASVLATYAGIALTGGVDATGAGALFPSPLFAAAVQLGVMLLTAGLAYRLGRAMGGTGDMGGAVLIVAWLQFVLLVVQVAQLLLFLILPPMGVALGYMAVGLFFWVFTGLLAELHGFRSLGLTFVAILLTVIAAAIVLSILLAILIGGSM